MKTAIFVRGHARTWHMTKDNNIQMLDDIYGGADWYFAATGTHTVSVPKLRSDFRGRNLITALLLDESLYPLPDDQSNVTRWRYFMPAYWKPAWFDYHLGIAKRKHELANGFRYDHVIFIRPDCWYFQVGQPERATKPLHSMSVSHIGQNGAMSMDDWLSDDLVWRAGSAAADLISLRWLDTHYDTNNGNQLIHGNSHALLASYVTRNMISYDPGTDSFKCTLIRPDHADLMPWSWEKNDESHNDSFTWHDRPPAEKLEFCQRLGIDPRDYQLC